MIQRGEADVVVAGGTEAALTSLCLAAFRRMGALSREGVSRPFDARRDGFVMGEGAAVLVLERDEHARARGATVLRARRRLRRVQRRLPHDPARRGGPRRRPGDARGAAPTPAPRPRDVGYINCHGTATPYNDRIETTAIHGVFNGARAAGVLDEVGDRAPARRGRRASRRSCAWRRCARGVLPPTINYEEADPDCDLDCVPGAPARREAELALSNSFGFGGQNACLAVAAA